MNDREDSESDRVFCTPCSSPPSQARLSMASGFSRVQLREVTDYRNYLRETGKPCSLAS